MKIKKEVKIGFWVCLALAILFFGINFLKGINIFKGSNYYYTSYASVEGLAQSAPVTLNGFKVGQVREIGVDFDNPSKVLVEISLDDRLKLPAGTKAVLASDLLGTASIALQLGHSPTILKAGDKLEGVNQSGLMDAVSDKLMPAVSEIFPKVDTLLTSVNMLVGNPALYTSISRLEGITADLRQSTQSIARMTSALEPLPSQLSPILADASQITGNVKSMTTNLDAASTEITELAQKFNAMPLDSLVYNLQVTTDNLRLLSQALNDPNGTVGRMLNDPTLYESIDKTVGSLDSLLTDIKKNPKRYVTIKVF